MTVLPEDIVNTVAQALAEDVGSGDLTTALIPGENHHRAVLMVNETAILCGTDWFCETFRQLDDRININWRAADGDQIQAGQPLCNLAGPARAILTGERTALNFLQTLSATATATAHYVRLVEGLATKILDTRKTVPGLRLAQKYAVRCGGGTNHRMGLYDAILIKENHIAAAGSIRAAIVAARQFDVPVEIEVENLQQLEEALAADCSRILLDNFGLDELREAVTLTRGKATLEASGGIDDASLRSVAESGVDYISIGALTKHIRAIDFSLRFVP